MKNKSDLIGLSLGYLGALLLSLTIISKHNFKPLFDVFVGLGTAVFISMIVLVIIGDYKGKYEGYEEIK